MLDNDQKRIFLKILPTLDESQKRWFVAMQANSLGRGGIQYIHKISGISRVTISRGLKEIKARKGLANAGIRSSGGGRKGINEVDPTLHHALFEIMEETTAGDPMSRLLWTCKSTDSITSELVSRGHKVSRRTINRILNEAGYSLQLNSKQLEGVSHQNRDEQFNIINKTVATFLKNGNPVISVDTKKKELIGNFKNDGKTWRKKGSPTNVNVYDFPSLAEGRAIPYGAYDIQRNEGFVNIGITHDTAEFAVNSIRDWWNRMGRFHYPEKSKLLICADGGGSNGSRVRAWKYNLQKLSTKIGIEISVCHYPPGTSKWNKIEHRMWSFISLQWKGKPLISYEAIINSIGATTTKKGLKIKAKIDKKDYEIGVKISDNDMKTLNIESLKPFPKWNYNIKPS